MRRRLLVAVAVLIAVAGLPTGANAASPDLLLLDGRGAVYADLTLSRTVGVLPLRLTVNGARDGWSWRGCGNVRGFYLRPLSAGPTSGVGAVDFAQLYFGASTSAPAAPNAKIPRLPVPLGDRAMGQQDMQPRAAGDPVTLRPGRYRVYLLATGACALRIPLHGLGKGIHLTATHRATMQWGVSDLDVASRSAGVPAPRAGVSTFPVSIRPSTFAFSLIHWLYYNGPGTAPVPSQTTVYGECIDQDPGAACLPDDAAGTPLPARARQRSRLYYDSSFGEPSITVLPTGTPALIATPDVTHFATWYSPGWLTPGPNVAKASTAVVGTATHVQAVMFALDM